MPGIPPSVIVHRLMVDLSHRLVKQRRRSFAPERNQAVVEEVQKLLQAEFIREVDYPEWLANVVVVKKTTRKWRMCVDFTDLNRACPKDSFPLPRIDLLVDSTSGHELLTFMDTFSGYNQVHMDEADQEKTSFITHRGLYCYKMMPFGLKNAGATYQRLVNKMFRDKIRRNIEVYVDNMLVKSIRAVGHIADLRETFETLRSHKMKLNLAKCAFGVSSRKFLGFMVSQRGIEANPEKVSSVLGMQSPQTTKQLQQLTGRIAALNRFISRSTDKCLPFFKILKKAFEWNSECEEAFGKLKEHLTSPPLLSRSDEGEIHYLYLAYLPWQSAQLWSEKTQVSKNRFILPAKHSMEPREVPSDRKVGLRLNRLGAETKTIFSSTCYTGVDRVSAEEDIAKTRPFWQVGELVGRVGAIRHRILPSNFYQGSGPN
jgi:hypothetical protein